MKILRLRLENFQGIEDLEINFGCQNAKILGWHATGKSTVANAIAWLLVGVPMRAELRYTPRTTGVDKENHIVEAEVKTVGGEVHTLKKVFHQVWTKTKMTGQATDYYIDELPLSAGDYESRLEALLGCPIDKAKMLVLPNYFPETMSVSDRRKILVDMAGDVSESDVMEAYPAMQSSRNALIRPRLDGHYTVSEFEAIFKPKLALTKKALTEIGASIAEAKRSIPNLTGKNRDDTEKKLVALNLSQRSLESERATASGANQLAGAIAETQSKISIGLAAHENTERAKEIDRLNSLASLNENLVSEKLELAKVNGQLTEAQRKLASMEAMRTKLLAEYAEIASKRWDDALNFCQTCERELDQDKIEAAKAKFNLGISEQKEAINKRGQAECSKELIEAKQKEIEGYEAKIDALNQSIAKLASDVNEASIKPAKVSYESTQEYCLLFDALTKLIDSDGAKEVEDKVAEIDERLEKISEGIKELTADISNFDLADKQAIRVSALVEKEKAFLQEVEQIEGGLAYCKAYRAAVIELLEPKINSIFKTVQWRMFRQQVNGDYVDDCEAIVPSGTGNMVPFASANNANRVLADIEIKAVLGKCWGVTLPVIVDNAESVLYPLSIDAQVIKLIVSGQDKSGLRVEIEKENTNG